MLTKENRNKLQAILKGKHKLIAETAGVSAATVDRFFNGKTDNEKVADAAVSLAETIAKKAEAKNTRVENLNI